MNQFVLDDIKIAFAEEVDGPNPSFPEGFVKIPLEKRKQFAEILEYVSFFGGDVVNSYTLTEDLRSRITETFNLQEYHKTFSYNSANRAMVIYRFSDDMVAVNKLNDFITKVKTRFGVDSVYITYLDKSMYEKESEEFISLELAVINPKIIFFMDKKENLEEWIISQLNNFKVEFKK